MCQPGQSLFGGRNCETGTDSIVVQITAGKNYTFMPRARLCRAEREQWPKSQHIPIACAIYRGSYIRHNLGGICSPKCGKQTPFIPSEVRKNLIGGLFPDLYLLSMAPDYAARKRVKSQRYHRIAAVTQDNQGRGINGFMSDAA